MMDNPHQIYSAKHPSPHGTVERYVSVKNQFIGFHAYENAPPEVAFLKESHRHVFRIESTVQVWHEDRDIEFFMMQEYIERSVIPFLALKPLGSCENIAENIMWALVNKYGDDRSVGVEVSEDGENSGTVFWNPSN